MTNPSNNDWRLAGAFGIDPDPTNPSVQETMFQGIGFPLRPVDGTPPTASPEIDNSAVAQGSPMQWMGAWNSGIYYPKGAFVRDGTVAAVANKLTLEKPAPVPDPADPETTGLPDPWVGVTTQSNTFPIESGQIYTFSQDGWIKELKVYAPEVTADTHYRVVVVDLTDPDSPVTTVIDNPRVVEDEWSVVAFFDAVVKAGNVLGISLNALNSSASTNIAGDWRYSGPSQTGAPPLREWTQDNQRTSFRISKEDFSGANRSAELESVTIDSIISVEQVTNAANTVKYIVTEVKDDITFMSYSVTLQSETGIIGTATICTIDIDVPVPLPTEYAEETSVWGAPPSWASAVAGFLYFGGAVQAVPITNAYGVDILFEPASVSEDWDIVSST
jgi:hypothetical protein